jgi:hypothetical protein
MKYAPKGKWFIVATDSMNGKKFSPLYDGFKTKKEALEMCEKLNNASPNVLHEIKKG